MAIPLEDGSLFTEETKEDENEEDLYDQVPADKLQVGSR